MTMGLSLAAWNLVVSIIIANFSLAAVLTYIKGGRMKS